MASLGATFDPNDVPQDERSFEPLPAGDYNCQITDSEIVETRTGGEMLKLTLEVIDGPYANRKVWDNLNIRNSNATAQSIAHRTLADLCAACGLGPIADSEELHFKPFVAVLKIEPERTVGDRTYDARNGVKRYKARGGQPPVGKAAAQPAARPAPQAARPAAAAPSRPWAKRSQPAATDDNIPF
jgi:Protein of unknown function (DUF669)